MTSSSTQQSVYVRLGEDTIVAMTSAFYERVKKDDILAPMYPDDDWEGAEQRLRDFLIFRFGGPDRYIKERGHPRLRMRHMPYAIDSAASERWVALMNSAMAETITDQAISQELGDFFAHVARFLQNKTTST